MVGKRDKRDLHSVEGSSSIHPFSPLDPADCVPQEEISAAGRGGLQLQRQGSVLRKMTRAEVAAVVGLPALLVLGIILGASDAPMPVVVVSVALAVLALAAFAFSGAASGDVS